MCRCPFEADCRPWVGAILPICDGFEASDLRIGVLGNADAAASKALFLRTYSRHVTLLRLDDKPCSVQQSRELSEAGVRFPKAPVRALARQENQLNCVSERRNAGSLGCDVRSELGKKLGACHNDSGCLEVDGHQQTSVGGSIRHRRRRVGPASNCGRYRACRCCGHARS
jgi:thioredoxin reductase (NADPH)